MTHYPQTVAAALSETASKFRLAEALATEIPPRRPGPGAETDVHTLLAEAREAIVAAGGEPRAIDTLDKYRRTALWVSAVNGRDFRWVQGMSLTAHNEARMSGMSYDDFATVRPTVRETRQALGKARPEGPAEKVVETWTHTEKVEAAKALLADSDVTRDVVQDDNTRVAVGRASFQHHEETERPLYRVEHTPTPIDLGARGTLIATDLERWVKQVADAAPLDAATTSLLQEIQRDIANANDWLAALVSSEGLTDESLARLIEEGTK